MLDTLFEVFKASGLIFVIVLIITLCGAMISSWFKHKDPELEKLELANEIMKRMVELGKKNDNKK